MPSMSYDDVLKLSGLPKGSLCLVTGMDVSKSAAVRMLHRMGIVEGEIVRVLSAGDCMMVDCGGSRIAVRREIAHTVQVVLVEEKVENCGGPVQPVSEPTVV